MTNITKHASFQNQMKYMMELTTEEVQEFYSLNQQIFRIGIDNAIIKCLFKKVGSTKK
jgi:hypothetical protein